MASRAHIIHDYSFSGGRSHPRQVWYRREDPVELPRTSIWRAGGGALLTAVAMGALVVGSVYAAFHEAPPQLAETPALPAIETWQPDASLNSARITNLLQGPALSVPDRVTPFMQTDLLEDVPATSSEAASSDAISPESRAPESREVIIDDSKMYPPAPAVTPTPYPNPTTTPPDAIAPPEATPGTPTPTIDAENPYRD